MSTLCRAVRTPIGTLTLHEMEGHLVRLSLPSKPSRSATGLFADSALLIEGERQLLAYFAGERTAFDLPLAPAGTPFQQSVWQALRDIPHGECRTYRDIATAIGNPKAARAVGMANNRNPLPILIPCHRVIGANGNLIGYAGGLALKEALLRLEGCPWG